MKNTLSAIAAVVLLAALAVALYLGGWWLTEDSVNRQTRIDRRSDSFVQARIDRARDDILEIEALDDGGQKASIVRGICASIADLPTDQRPDDIESFAITNC